MNTSAGQSLDLIAWMDSLADPTRLRLLHLLCGHELGVVDLCDVLQMPQSTVSRHLKALTDAGWTRSRREGTTNRYCVPIEELAPQAGHLWDLVSRQTRDWPTVDQDALRLKHRLEERRRDTRRFFADAATDWERLRREYYGSQFCAEALMELIPADWVVADLGCGTGPIVERLAPRVRRVIGVDNSPQMLDAARQRIGDHGNVELREGDLESLPIDDRTCDAALLVLVLSYVDDVLAVLREAARVLKGGGAIVIVDLLLHDREDFRRDMGQCRRGFAGDDLSGSLTAAGFRDARYRPLPPEPQAKGPVLVLASARK